jgi:hypothetical protein
MNPTITESMLTQQVQAQMRRAGVLAYQRHPLPGQHPSFKTAAKAALNLLSLLTSPRNILVMRDASLGPVREAILDSPHHLLIPDSHNPVIFELGPENRSRSRFNDHRIVLRIDPLSPGARPASGPPQIILVAFLGFDPDRGAVYSFDQARTAETLDRLQDIPGMLNAPVIGIGSDAQQVIGWPDWARAEYRVDLVVTESTVWDMHEGVAVPAHEFVTRQANSNQVRQDVCATVIGPTSTT